MHASAGDRTATPSRHAGPRVLSETPRCMARCAWQSDADADKCSISRCNNTFSWMPGARRHHCRQCGRVVCQDCSRGQRLLLPPLGEKGPAKKVRVCNACLRNSETFLFHDDAATAGAATRRPTLLTARLPTAVAPDHCIEYALTLDAAGDSSKHQSAIGRLLQAGTGRAACSYDGKLVLADKLPLSTLSTAETPIHGTGAQGQDQGAQAGVRMPQGMAQGAATAQPMPARSSPKSNLDWEYYQGLKTYEPAALALLLSAQATQSTQGAD